MSDSTAKYYLLTHEYDTVSPEYFCSEENEDKIKKLNAYIQFLYEELTDVSESIDTNDILRIMHTELELKPLDKRIQDVSEWVVIDGYVLRESNLCQ
jgi:hypothetical protein